MELNDLNDGGAGTTFATTLIITIIIITTIITITSITSITSSTMRRRVTLVGREGAGAETLSRQNIPVAQHGIPVGFDVLLSVGSDHYSHTHALNTITAATSTTTTPIPITIITSICHAVGAQGGRVALRVHSFISLPSIQGYVGREG